MSDATNKNLPHGKAPPRHIAIIMDGNNRWAKLHRKGVLAGHRAGVNSVKRVIEGCIENGVEALTLFAFSSENWRRPALEVRGLMELFRIALIREVPKLVKNNIRLRIIGDRSRFSKDLQKRIAQAEEDTAGCTGFQLNVAANYGGQWDICNAAKQLAEACVRGELSPDQIDAELLDRHTCLADLPKPDLCIRTGGEQRVSNFLIWQFAYTEFYFSPLYWPDFGKEQIREAILDFCTRERRFGKTSEQLKAEQHD
ncbi:polyprenyl diphosphate synthase [Marinobacterium lutimaris]|uniref:Ditrans,polycis-undecaprenyl-diphosphate synthase ((2E,6E)-farnesyl-diphosphate specific) n=1 Tax=Marinobacterium lutimaris TaxID=568106 RepID=A0A1H6BJS5_9GAMM|nr:polyprenyl diphosphate synthase [Marinobacterium lutimaris]SEG60665.1 Undecaprenyl pyrophosphate synthetase [Marinobacterium lutimaris]